MPPAPVIVVGAGMAGLVTALLLAHRGVEVLVCERGDQPGGKLREVPVAGQRIDAGPTVFTMRWVFDELLAEVGTHLEAELGIRPLEILARHAWDQGGRLDLFADLERTVAAIGDFAGAAAARGYRDFCREARGVYQTLEQPFIRAPRPTPVSLVGRVGPFGLKGLLKIRPFETLWQALGEHFPDPRLRQLFGRYATYCGSSPFLAPATLMLIAHVEQEGVWTVDGGMHQIAAALTRLAMARGARFRFGTEVAEILSDRRRVSGVRLATGEALAARAVVMNGDVAALRAGLLGAAASGLSPPPAESQRSLSAMTWNLVAPTEGFPLVRHSVFFSRDYPAEFDAIFRQGRLPAAPTVYVCAQDRAGDVDWPGGAIPGRRAGLADGKPPPGEARGASGWATSESSGEGIPIPGMGAGVAFSGPERLLCLVNAPAIGDTHAFSPAEIESCEASAFSLLERCGLRVQRSPANTRVTTPTDFNRLFPATGGALYGQASHGWKASFNRPGTRTKLPGLYLAGGSVHPGAGVPMAALSGRLAAACVLSDLTSTSR